MPLYGPDISNYQAGISFGRVPADLVAIYATGGTAVGNPSLHAQVADAKANGARVLLYHYARETGAQGTPGQEAQHFLDTVAGLDADGYVLDWEDPPSVPYTAWAKEWLDTVRAATGKTVWIYVSFADLGRADYSAIHDAGYPLWEAAYVLGYQRIDGYTVPGGQAKVPYWGDPQMWQFTSSGYLPGWGGALDLNVFYGTAGDWAALHSTTAQSTTVTPIQEQDMPITQDDANLIADTILGRKWATAPGAVLGELLNEYRDQHVSVQGWVNGARDAVNTHTDAAVQGLSLTITDAQVQALADRLKGTLPAAQIAALAAQLQK